MHVHSGQREDIQHEGMQMRQDPDVGDAWWGLGHRLVAAASALVWVDVLTNDHLSLL